MPAVKTGPCSWGGGRNSTRNSGGMPTGAGAGYQRDNKNDEVAIPLIREQQMRLCTVQLVRVLEEPRPPATEKTKKLWWVYLATE